MEQRGLLHECVQAFQADKRFATIEQIASATTDKNRFKTKLHLLLEQLASALRSLSKEQAERQISDFLSRGAPRIAYLICQRTHGAAKLNQHAPAITQELPGRDLEKSVVSDDEEAREPSIVFQQVQSFVFDNQPFMEFLDNLGTFVSEDEANHRCHKCGIEFEYQYDLVVHECQ